MSRPTNPSLNRRRLLVRGAATAAALAAPALAARAQATVTLKFHTFMAPVSAVWNTMHKPWMAQVEAASGGRIRFEAFPAMTLGGNPAQLYEQVRDGVADIVWTLPGYTAGRFPRVEAFELPFTMTGGAESTSRALWAYVQQHAAEEFRDTRLLAAHVHGPGALHLRDKPVRTPADLRGLKLRGPTRQVTRLLAALGASPVGMPLPQIGDALSKGTIDGAALPWEVVPSVRVQELVRHHSEFAAGASALYTATFVMAMNRARYDAMPADLRAVIDAHSGAATSAAFGRTQQANDEAGRQAARSRGNTLHVFDDAATREFVRLSARIDDEWVAEMDKRGLKGGELLSAARALIARSG
jgi:TRAP-type C4-dicarboxylate transport system substrate-binding protein